MNEEQLRAKIDELEAKQQRCRDGMEQIISRAETDSRSLTAGEDEKLDVLQTGAERAQSEANGLRAALRSMEATSRGDYSMVEFGDDRGVPSTPTPSSRRSASGPFVEQKREAFSVLQRSDTISDQLADRVADLVERDESPQTALYAAAAADPDYARSFAKLFRDPQNGHRNFSTAELAAHQRAEYALRSLNLSTGAAMIPTHLDANVLLSSAGTSNPFREAARVETGITPVWNGVSSAGVSSDWTAEEVEVGDNSPAFASPTVTAYKATSFVPISYEAHGDMVLGDGASQLLTLFADEQRIREAVAFVSGNGTTRPRGLITALAANTNSQVSNIASNVFSAEDVYALIEALPPRFRERARWLANLSIMNDIEQFETTNGARLFPGIDSASPTLIRRPIHEVSDMAGINVAAATIPLVIGDMSNYLIYDRFPSQLEFIPNLFGTTNGRPTGQRGYLHWTRTGGNCLVDNGFRALLSATNG